jgi:hypothetical protein
MKVIPRKWINVLNAATAANNPPSAATDGLLVPPDRVGKGTVIRLRHTTTAGDDARTCTVKLWGYCPGEIAAPKESLPTLRAETDIASSAGWDDMDEEYSLTSVSADGNVTAFVLEYPTIYQRLYVELTAVTGTGTAISCAIGFTTERE